MENNVKVINLVDFQPFVGCWNRVSLKKGPFQAEGFILIINWYYKRLLFRICLYQTCPNPNAHQEKILGSATPLFDIFCCYYCTCVEKIRKRCCGCRSWCSCSWLCHMCCSRIHWCRLHRDTGRCPGTGQKSGRFGVSVQLSFAGRWKNKNFRNLSQVAFLLWRVRIFGFLLEGFAGIFLSK